MKNKKVILNWKIINVVSIVSIIVFGIGGLIFMLKLNIQNQLAQDIVVEEQIQTQEIKWFSSEFEGIKSLEEEVNIEKIIQKNVKNEIKTIIETEVVELEHETEYINTKELPAGTIKVTQKGEDGKQELIIKKQYKGKKLISDEHIGTKVVTPALNKVILIGIGKDEDSVEENGTESENTEEKLVEKLSKDMPLNKPSGLTLSQFKKMFKDEKKDKNGVFEENAEYFYYIEQSYGINGVFVAAIGIHESAWGTSRIAKDKKNLFGYGAYDMNAYASAYSYNGYAAGIDMIARVLMKNYLNPKGTVIYNGEIATGKYYNGNTVAGVNKRYATDKNWANSVYKWMEYLYGKI